MINSKSERICIIKSSIYANIRLREQTYHFFITNFITNHTLNNIQINLYLNLSDTDYKVQ